MRYNQTETTLQPIKGTVTAVSVPFYAHDSKVFPFMTVQRRLYPDCGNHQQQHQYTFRKYHKGQQHNRSNN